MTSGMNVDGHCRIRGSASEEDSDVAGPAAPSLQNQLRSVRMMSLASLVLGLASVAMMASVFARPTGAAASSEAGLLGLSAIPGQPPGELRGWYRTYLDSQVREGEDLQSAKVKTLYAGSLVYVAEGHGRRVRILRPVAGWMSMRTEEGVEILRPDATYEAGPDKSDIEAVFRSRKVREANERLQDSAVQLTKIEQQLLEAVKKLKNVPKHVEAKFKEKWPELAEQAPKAGEHVVRHAAHVYNSAVKPQAAEKLLAHMPQNEHTHKIGHFLKRATQEVKDVEHMQQAAGKAYQFSRDTVAV